MATPEAIARTEELEIRVARLEARNHALFRCMTEATEAAGLPSRQFMEAAEARDGRRPATQPSTSTQIGEQLMSGNWAVIASIAFYLLSDSEGAAHTVGGLLGDLKGPGNSLATFGHHLGH